MTEAERLAIDQIAKRYGIAFEARPLPTDDDVAAVVAERLTALLEARLRERDRLRTERSQRFVPLARQLAENQDESRIIAMLLDDYYQETLHTPPADPGVERPDSMRLPPRKRGSDPSGSSDGRPRRRSRSGGRSRR